ncbi:MAG: DUF6443 domain-containing protein [Agriterribacter sp.]
MSINNKSLTLLISLLVITCVNAQTPRPVPQNYSAGMSLNFVSTWEALYPEENADLLVQRGLREVRQSTQYFDGLGRPLQTVIKQGSYPTGGAAVDMISTVEYDAFGREAFKYLPTPGTTADGKFKLDPFMQQAAFYGGANASIADQGEAFFYSQTNFEASPLNRVTEQFAPGNNWAGTASQTAEVNRRSVKTKYHVNTTTDDVKIWTTANGAELGDWGSYTVDPNLGTNGVYNAGSLHKTIIADEHNKQVIEFKDKEGKVILKKVQLDAAADNGSGTSYAGWLCTYYIYDDIGNLRCVIQPEGVQRLSQNNWTVTADLLNEYFFCYEYDHRNRMIMKKLPGITQADAEYMVYDARDRLVLTQTGKQRAPSVNVWIANLYENDLNRLVIRGFYVNKYNNKTFKQNLADAATSIEYPFPITRQPSIAYWAALTQYGYDDYSTLPSSSGLTGTLDNTYTSSTYLNSTYNTSPLYAQQPLQSNKTKGMVTWMKVLFYGSKNYYYVVNLYDDKGRLIQTKSTNITGGTDITTTQYNWSGQPIRVVQKQQVGGAVPQTNITLTNISYDDLGRVERTQKKIQNSLVKNNQLPTAWTLIHQNQYDALGQLKNKTLGNKKDAAGNPTADLLSSQDYQYNIRGWLLSINKEYTTATANNNQYFALELGYDKDPSLGSNNSKQYNGNIGSLLWKSAGDPQQRKYDFIYDAANRLKASAFGQYASGAGASAAFNTDAGIDFSEDNIQYDLNGNIKTYNRKGLGLNGSNYIDQLSYQYAGNNASNRLERVDETATGDNGKLGDFKNGTNAAGTADYAYNESGSLTIDKNKGISSISYWRTLELPKTITTAQGTITYTYDDLGNKVEKETIEKATPANGNKKITTTTTYLGGMVIESRTTVPADPNNPDYTNKLLFIGHEEGRTRPTTLSSGEQSFVYDYFLKDHLGNIRMVLTDELKEDIYPMATMETAKQATEEILYGNINATRAPKPAGYPADATTNPNDYVAKVNGSGNKIGPSILLKVMAGDKLNIRVNSWYKKNGATPGSPTSLLTSLVAALAGGVSNAAPVHGTAAQLTSSGTLDPAAMDFLNSRSAVTGGKPKAALNWIFLDEQLKFSTANGAYGTEEIDDNDNQTNVKPHAINDISIKKNGYFFVYVSNETPNIDVFFDNLQVVHKRGPVLEETHYYPFGLTMAGISSKALNGVAENKRKFNYGNELQNKEFSDGRGLELYDATFRQYDPQIGRFHQVDPLASMINNWSPYVFVQNNPLLYSDPLGLDTLNANKDGSLPTARPNGSNLQDTDVILGEDGQVANYYNGESWQAPQQLENVTVSTSSQQENRDNEGFWSNNWPDVAFMTNDLAQALANNSSIKVASRYRLPETTLQLPLGVTARASTKIIGTIAKVTKPIAKAAPWVAGGAIVYNVVSNKRITAGDIYQGIVTGLSVVPGWGLAVGGLALVAEGISYYYTGQSISDNINQSLDGGVIHKWGIQ